MRAVLLDHITRAEEIRLTQVPTPEAQPGWVLVQVKAFGLNHSEQILRLSEIEADYIQKPIIPGIECAGVVADPSDSGLAQGQKVIAMMGGMGRSFHGSYAEYALLPKQNVFPVQTDLPWERLGAIPETYFTAWGSLFECLQLKKEDCLLIRGATCALGYAAMQLAKALGCQVVATTHRAEKLPLLQAADEALLDDGGLSSKGLAVTKVLDLVGPRYLRDSLRTVLHGGIVCATGILGGVFALNGFDPIKEIPNGVYLTGFFSNYPTRAVVEDLFAFLNTHALAPTLGMCYHFDEIAAACLAQDQGKADGKIVVVL